METSVISYNLKDRGRRYRGRDRHYNIAQIIQAVNAPETQERVKNRDMLGYYGHWPRIKYGMNPVEGGLEDGKPALVEPALVTVFLKGLPDGTIQHQAQFLNTDSGAVAAKLYESHVGGFSSAIIETPPRFYGFDYVLEPNYTTNRGYTLDDVNSMSPDDIEAAIYGEQIRGLLKVLDGVSASQAIANETIDHLRTENEQLLSMLASRNGGKIPKVYLDGVMPATVSKGIASRMREDIALFNRTRLSDLPRFADDPNRKSEVSEAPDSPLIRRILGRF